MRYDALIYILSNLAMNTGNSKKTWYELIDSGAEKRWERFGDVVLVRPSRLAIWKPALKNTPYDAEFVHEKGWTLKNKNLDAWVIKEGELSLKLRLQDNGQIGLFPEHASYLPKIGEALSGRATPRVLNLFAYTGLATCYAAQHGANVTHVDISKKVLDWCTENLAINNISKESYRFIREDALAFLRKEASRGNSYDMVICDPPSFSRLSAKDTWNLEEVLGEIVQLCVKVLKEKKGALFLTNHHYESGGHVLANLVREHTKASVNVEELLLPQKDSAVVLPAGFLVYCSSI